MIPTSPTPYPILQSTSILSNPVRAALLGYEMLGAVLGVFIAYLAYRGYRRNQYRPMLFVAIGFIFALGMPLVITLPYVLLPTPDNQIAVQVVNQTFEVVGLLCIIYGLRA